MATCRSCAYLRKCIEKATKEGCEHNVDFDPKDGCTGIGFKSNTNADRIRAMSDGELVKFIGHNSLCDQIQNDERKWCDAQAVCDNCLFEWLKQPAEVNDG